MMNTRIFCTRKYKEGYEIWPEKVSNDIKDLWTLDFLAASGHALGNHRFHLCKQTRGVHLTKASSVIYSLKHLHVLVVQENIQFFTKPCTHCIIGLLQQLVT